MKYRLVRAIGILALVLGFATMPAMSATAITGGVPDGNGHPNVGLILFYTPDGRFRCTGTLVSPTVILTAAHCTCLLYTSPSPRDRQKSRMPSSA